MPIGKRPVNHLSLGFPTTSTSTSTTFPEKKKNRNLYSSHTIKSLFTETTQCLLIDVLIYSNKHCFLFSITSNKIRQIINQQPKWKTLSLLYRSRACVFSNRLACKCKDNCSFSKGYRRAHSPFASLISRFVWVDKYDFIFILHVYEFQSLIHINNANSKQYK